jgi:hypothetical protein
MSRSIAWYRLVPEVLGRVGSPPMRKLLYLPFAVVGSILARILGRQVFRTVWERIDEEPPPAPGEGRGSTAKVIGGHALQAAVMAGSAAAVERVLARSFHHLLGIWPRKPPKPKD